MGAPSTSSLALSDAVTKAFRGLVLANRRRNKNLGWKEARRKQVIPYMW